MSRLIVNAFYWFLDYLYVAKVEISSMFDRSHPEKYRTKNGKQVLLIPGIYENWRFMQPIAKLLHSRGYDVHVIEKLGYNTGTVEQMALIAKEYIEDNHLSNVTIISHSKGGLIGKYLLNLIPDVDTLAGLIALNAPFSGSKYAYVLPFRSLRDFIPTSKTLTLLAIDRISNARIVSIYGRFDPHIPGGSRLEGAKNIQLNTYGHFRIVNDSHVHKAIIKNIKAPLYFSKNKSTI